jgi:hypothetical protein
MEDTKYTTHQRLLPPITKFEELEGRTLSKIVGVRGDEEMRMYLTDENYVRFYHDQDCCECVDIEDIVGDLDDLIGTPLLMVEKSSNSDDPPSGSYNDSYTWTYYRFRTIKGSVDIRWFGSSNGYYSEGVSIKVVND